MALVLYLIIRKDDLAQCTRQLAVPRRYVTAKWNYIGLREPVAEAAECRRKNWGESEVTYDTHIFVKGIVTHVGFEVLSRLAIAPEDSFAPTFSIRSRPMVSPRSIGRYSTLSEIYR